MPERVDFNGCAGVYFLQLSLKCMTTQQRWSGPPICESNPNTSGVHSQGMSRGHWSCTAHPFLSLKTLQLRVFCALRKKRCKEALLPTPGVLLGAILRSTPGVSQHRFTEAVLRHAFERFKPIQMTQKRFILPLMVCSWCKLAEILTDQERLVIQDKVAQQQRMVATLPETEPLSRTAVSSRSPPRMLTTGLALSTFALMCNFVRLSRLRFSL